ncbi:MAG: hypothetical protein J0H78_15235 [Rhizobiales bacterium]|nr:hypothetical protein [Hyphomicrobiales bacterium]OJY44615.1 MAG: hypothetical protein BGP08_14570 [Rhizobiales bacterium 64-17]
MTAQARIRDDDALHNDAIEVDATLIAAAFDLTPDQVMRELRQGIITSRSEHGIDTDAGRRRLTFFRGRKRVRIVLDAEGMVLQQTSLDLGEPPPHR